MMKLAKHTAMLMLMLLVLAGCAHPFGQLPVDRMIVAGQTTKNEVFSLLGEPDRMYTSSAVKAVSGDKEYLLQDPSEIWLYYPRTLNITDLLEFKSLRIVFDSRGIVTDHSR